MSTWLRAALALQLLFFVGWGGRLMTSHRDVAVVWLATEPVDPRDLLSGNYVALRFRIASMGAALCEPTAAGDAGGPVYVQLVPSGEVVQTAEGEATIAEAIACTGEMPSRMSGSIWIEGRRDPESRRIAYGIERMFVGEENPLRNARSGTVVAKVAINDQFEPRLLEVVTKEQTPGDS
jgi:uncharacterized membrane-anchored protein